MDLRQPLVASLHNVRLTVAPPYKAELGKAGRLREGCALSRF